MSTIMESSTTTRETTSHTTAPVVESTPVVAPETKSEPIPLPASESPVTLTEKAAAEVLRVIGAEHASGNTSVKYLRLRVIGAGCSGFKNRLDLDTEFNPKLDQLYVLHGVNLIVDKRSALYLSGAVVDYYNELNKQGFHISNPNAKSTCGCGSSYSM